MPIANNARNMQTTMIGNDNYLVFEDTSDKSIKFNKINRTDIDSSVQGGTQQNIISTAGTLLNHSDYDNGNIQHLDLYGDEGSGIVRLTIILEPDAANQSKVFMGRIEGTNWIQCANSPITVGGQVREIAHVNGNSNEINIIRTVTGDVYFEGH